MQCVFSTSPQNTGNTRYGTVMPTHCCCVCAAAHEPKSCSCTASCELPTSCTSYIASCELPTSCTSCIASCELPTSCTTATGLLHPSTHIIPLNHNIQSRGACGYMVISCSHHRIISRTKLYRIYIFSISPLASQGRIVFLAHIHAGKTQKTISFSL